jgi:hypothetical protein
MFNNISSKKIQFGIFLCTGTSSAPQNAAENTGYVSARVKTLKGTDQSLPRAEGAGFEPSSAALVSSATIEAPSLKITICSLIVAVPEPELFNE